MQDHPTTKQNGAAVAIVLAPCLALNAVVLGWIVLRHPFINADFLGFWSYPRFAPLAEIYDPGAMMRFQQSLYPGFRSFYPFTYPPVALLFCGWLRDLGYNTARAVWLLAGLAVFAASGLALFRGRFMPVAALLASPAALLCIVSGQSSFFIGALLLGGLAALPRRPMLAGLLFGLLIIKPQMALLLPILLLARGEFRALAMAALTAALLVALTYAVLPPELWRLWLTSLPQIQCDYFTGGTNLNIMISPAANVLHLGAGPGVAAVVQVLCTLAAAVLTWRMARRGTYAQATALLLAATFLAQPHAYIYDSVILPAAFALAGPYPRWVQALIALLYVAPLLLLTPWAGGCIYALPLAVFAASIFVRAEPRPAPPASQVQTCRSQASGRNIGL